MSAPLPMRDGASTELHALLMREIASNADTLCDLLKATIGGPPADAINNMAAMLRIVQVIGFMADAGVSGPKCNQVRGDAADWLLDGRLCVALSQAKAAEGSQ